MTVDDLKEFYKAESDAGLARILKRNRSVIHYWREGGIPLKTQATFQILTNGKLKANIQQLTA